MLEMTVWKISRRVRAVLILSNELTKKSVSQAIHRHYCVLVLTMLHLL